MYKTHYGELNGGRKRAKLGMLHLASKTRSAACTDPDVSVEEHFTKSAAWRGTKADLKATDDALTRIKFPSEWSIRNDYFRAPGTIKAADWLHWIATEVAVYQMHLIKGIGDRQKEAFYWLCASWSEVVAKVGG